jgi:diguanylate cyclase (GGDEF)-like protein/PAS domain S-box-containing protein
MKSDNQVEALSCATPVTGVEYSELSGNEQEQILLLQQAILESVALGGDHMNMINSVCKLEEQLLPNSVGSVMLLDASEQYLNVYAAPSIPPEGIAQLNGLVPGPQAGSCGNVIYRQEAVFVSDTLTDPRWSNLRKLAIDFGLMACWSMPIRSMGGKVVGTFALSSFERRSPSPFHRKLLEIGAFIIGIVLEQYRAQESLRLSAQVFEGSNEAIMITDAEQRIVRINRAFTKVTHYGLEDILGKTPKILSSGRHDAAFFHDMWQRIENFGHWQGEIWNRRKNDEIFPEWLSISSVRDAAGKLTNYIAMFSDITDRKKIEARVEFLAYHDALTGIPNRALLGDRMRQAIAQTSREQNMLAVCYLDLDGFKPINDALGHEAGDQVLIEISKRIEGTIRGGDTISRLGGDEFVVLLLGLARGEECVATLERLLEAIALPLTIKEHIVKVSASIGVCIYPLDDEDPDTLLRHADQAMYQAKQAGKNRFHIYDPALDQRAREQNDFMKSLRNGLELNQFELYYQPKVDLRTKALVGAEALIRWRHPERGLLAPAAFLRFVENTDLDIEIGEWVTATALAQIAHWQSAGLDIEVSINISGYHLESPDFLTRLQQQLKNYPDMSFGKLQIEVLETVALNDIAIVQGIIEACRKLGVEFALDDFGTGYSSLSYLSRLPVDVLKIDQSFVRDMLEDKGGMAIVQGIIALARAFNRRTVAEGIETQEHYRALLDMGCELGQGYGIARPMPASELMNWQTLFSPVK